MTKNSADLLSGIYKITPNKVYIIHHGVPAFTARDRKMLKQEYGFAGQELITTFGLIGPGKGIEIGIMALKENTAIIYDRDRVLIRGQTHPCIVIRQSPDPMLIVGPGQQHVTRPAANQIAILEPRIILRSGCLYRRSYSKVAVCR